jgi:hypothetical protein
MAAPGTSETSRRDPAESASEATRCIEVFEAIQPKIPVQVAKKLEIWLILP